MNPSTGAGRKPTSERGAADEYVSRLREQFGRYARPSDEARRLVDDSMGQARLTDILYESRKD